MHYVLLVYTLKDSHASKLSQPVQPEIYMHMANIAAIGGG